MNGQDMMMGRAKNTQLNTQFLRPFEGDLNSLRGQKNEWVENTVLRSMSVRENCAFFSSCWTFFVQISTVKVIFLCLVYCGNPVEHLKGRPKNQRKALRMITKLQRLRDSFNQILRSFYIQSIALGYGTIIQRKELEIVNNQHASKTIRLCSFMVFDFRLQQYTSSSKRRKL